GGCYRLLGCKTHCRPSHTWAGSAFALIAPQRAEACKKAQGRPLRYSKANSQGGSAVLRILDSRCYLDWLDVPSCARDFEFRRASHVFWAVCPTCTWARSLVAMAKGVRDQFTGRS